MKLITTIILLLLSFSISALAYDPTISIYSTDTEILKHIDDHHVVVGVKLNIGNNGPGHSIRALVKALDNNGYELARVVIEDSVAAGETKSVSGTLRMKKFSYLRTDAWVVADIQSY